MNKEFQMLRKKQRFGLRKLNIGLVSVLLGFTIFGYNLASQAPVAHAATVATSAGSGASGGASGSASNSQAARTTSSAAPASQATPATQGSGSAASQISTPANSGNATSSPVSQAGTVSANQTSNTSAAGAPASSDQTVTVDETTLPGTQAAIPSTNLARLTKFKVGTRQRYSAMLLTNLAMLPNSETDTPLPTTTQTYDKVEQPLLYDYGLHTSVTGTRDGQTWVDKTIATGVWDYRGDTLDTIFGKTSKPGTGIIGSNPDKYFFAAYVDFSEQYHRVILLARNQDPSDKNLYSYTIHTYWQKTSTTTIKPGDNIKEQYTGVAGSGGSKYDLIFHNYGDSFTVKLNDFDGKWGMLPVFDGGLLDPTYGSNSYKQNDTAAQTEPISFWASAIPQKTSTKVRYVDQATGKDIVQPMEISGFGYQGFKVKGEAPTVTGYHLVSKPEFLPSTNKASAYEDGTISPYKVGQTYDLALSDSVVIKQTVIDTNGTVRATAYYNGSRLPSTDASKVLGRESNNDHMSFGAPDGKFYTYTNRIGQVDGSYIYYYAKDSDPKGSDMRLHFIDVTGVNNSSYAPSDGPELGVDKVQTIHGNIGEDYGFTYTVPTNYYEVGSSDVTGKYSGTNHDAYVYVKKQAENKLYAPVASDPLTVEQGTTLTTEQAKAAVKYNGDVPSDATYAWDPKTPVDTATVGSYTPNVIVTYGDGTTSSVPVTVNVVAKTDKSKYTVAAGQPVTLTHGQKVKVGDSLDSSAVTLKDAKGQPVSWPAGAQVVWTTTPDTSEVGNGKTGQAKVVYGDKSESEPVEVTYNVVPNQADTKTPEAGKVTVNKGETPSAQGAISNNKDLPEGTQYDWKEPIDTTTPGDKTGTVEVTYPDGSSEEVPGVTVHVNSDADLINAQAG
ncbi:Rib/alpha-like domain-containing protein, partial [Limosilactobacillus reuteri]|uniref:Rib/alpha-like domain-containing protein n=1 Tax=Limosilactobacillus reuteri TaxID=1598 RepID=UPI00130207DD